MQVRVQGAQCIFVMRCHSSVLSDAILILVCTSSPLALMPRLYWPLPDKGHILKTGKARSKEAEE